MHRRYLISVALARVEVLFRRDPFPAAAALAALFGLILGFLVVLD